ncbi:MAG: exodeoxyribonuclease I, partial [Candidatus Saccharimonadales bacterium]
MQLKPVGKPVNHLIKLTPDIRPSPDAVLVTGITPQRTLADGLTEAEFLKIFHKEVVAPDTIFVGFNSIRFDDEFMRFLLYRNFYDAYEWQWKDGRSRWDLLDVVRMTRALRPGGIEWPFAPDGRPANRLEMLTAVNKLDHGQAHDALSDVQATIAVARLLKDKQPDLFDYLLNHRDKKIVSGLVETGQPFVYTSGKYTSEFHHTTAAVLLAKRPKGEALVYDLRHDPALFTGLSVDELVDRWRFTDDPDAPPRLPVKTIKYNRCPAVAPLGVIKDAKTQERLGLTLETIAENRDRLRKVQKEFADKVVEAISRMDARREAEQAALVDNELTVDSRLYDGFLPDSDRAIFPKVRAAEPERLGDFADKLNDGRLKNLLPLYKARNYPGSLSDEERQT